MGLFGRRSKVVDEPSDDGAWIGQGNRRFEAGKSRHFGSPETMRAGGDQAAGKGDIGAAVFYYAKAIDIAQTWASNMPGQRPIQLDEQLFNAYATTLETIRRIRPDADVVTDWNNENARYALPMMVSIARTWLLQGYTISQLDQYINRVVASTGLTIN